MPELSLDVMGREGHLSIKWDPAVKEDVARAETAFNDLKAKGYLFFVTDGEKTKVVKTFNDALAEISVSPPEVAKPKSRAEKKAERAAAKRSKKSIVAAPKVTGG